MKVTRTLQSNANNLDQVKQICKMMGFIRADIWRRYGGLNNVGRSSSDIRKQITALGIYSSMPIDGTIRAETTKDVVNDILSYKAAALKKVRKAIYNHTTDETEQKRLFTLLNKDEWLNDPFLHRQMRQHFKHGKSSVNNQFIVRSDKYTTQIIDDNLVVTIHVSKKYGDNIQLTTTSNGHHVHLKGTNLRIILEDDLISIHYATEKSVGRVSGTQEIGIDKGYTEAFVDSDGQCHGVGFGKIMTRYSDKVCQTGKQRNKLHALEKKYRQKGQIAKADRIRNNNLGRKKLNQHRLLTQQQLKNIAYKAAHGLVDKANSIISEDLTLSIGSQQQWKQYNRRMSSWAKGILADALDSVTKQRNANHVLVNCAYTSQMDSITQLLEGKRVGDKFYHVNGDVTQADWNAAMNILARAYDKDITRYMPFYLVKKILLKRSSGGTDRQGLELLIENINQPSADKSH